MRKLPRIVLTLQTISLALLLLGGAVWVLNLSEAARYSIPGVISHAAISNIMD